MILDGHFVGIHAASLEVGTLSWVFSKLESAAQDISNTVPLPLLRDSGTDLA